METSALDGLRGWAAIHILIHHTLSFSPFTLNALAGVQMPLFFMLSGYCLTLGYGKKIYAGLTACCGRCQRVDKASSWIKCGPCLKKADLEHQPQATADILPVFNTWKFYWNRFTRVFPVFFICWLYPIIAIPLGHSYYPPKFSRFNVAGPIEQLLGLHTMIVVHGFAPNGPAWFLSTLSIYYWIYPSFLVRAQRWTTKKLQAAVVWFFYAQWIIGLVFWLTFYFYGNWYLVFMMATTHPISRLPVFLMGVCAGLLSKRERQERVEIFPAKSQNPLVTFLHDLLPWSTRVEESNANNIKTSKSRTWKWRVNACFAFYILVIAVFVGLHILYKHVINYWGVPRSVLNDLKYPEVGLEVEMFKDQFWLWPGCHLQFFLPHLQLVMIVGLCRDGGLSWFSRFFKIKVSQFLGKISMALYLVHEPLIFFICLALYGPLYEWPGSDATMEEKLEFKYKKLLPLWGLPVHIAISLICGTLLTYLVEAPAKNCLRKLGDKWWFRKEDENDDVNKNVSMMEPIDITARSESET